MPEDPEIPVPTNLALIVIEDPGHDGRYRWLLLQAARELDQVEEHSASDDSFASASDAFEAGTLCRRAAMNHEDEDADPVGDNKGSPNPDIWSNRP